MRLSEQIPVEGLFVGIEAKLWNEAIGYFRQRRQKRLFIDTHGISAWGSDLTYRLT